MLDKEKNINNNIEKSKAVEKLKKIISSLLISTLIIGNGGYLDKVNASEIVSWYQLEKQNVSQFSSIKGYLEYDPAFGEFDGKYYLIGYDIKRLTISDKNKIEKKLKYFGINVELDKLDINILKLYFQKDKKVKLFGLKTKLKINQEVDLLYFIRGNYFYVLGYKMGNSYDFNLFRYPVRYRIYTKKISKYERKLGRNGQIIIDKIEVVKKEVKIYGEKDKRNGIKKLFLEIEF